MTWSIVARDPNSGSLGIAVASKFFAVGAVTPYIASGVGAVCTQALVNPYLAIHALQLLRAGIPLKIAFDSLLSADPRHQWRQIHIVSTAGENAAFTGVNCVDWAGHEIRENVSVAGNMLVSRRVIDESIEAYQANLHRPFAERLLRALNAGEHAGGDKRGRQSAALIVYGKEEYSELDIRVDDHDYPIAELWRLYEMAHDRYLAYRACMPSKETDPTEFRDREQMETCVSERLRQQTRVDFSNFWKRIKD